MRIALATCQDLPHHEVDDAPLHDALAARGVTCVHPAWDAGDEPFLAADACLIRTTWDYMERRDEYVAWAERIAAAVPLFNPAPIIRWNTHKWYLRDLESKGVPIVPTVWLPRGSSPEVGAAMAERGWTRGFIKPAVGATARETLRFDADGPGLSAAHAHLARLLAAEDMMLQPYLPRVETDGELSAIVIGGTITHGVRKVPVSGDYRVQDDFGAHDEPATLNDAECALVHDVVGAVGADLLYARVDFLRDAAGSLCVTELELVEPSLFFRHGPQAADRLATTLLERLAAHA